MRANFPDCLILRHGETVWNREGRMQGSLDSPLTELGREQAARQAQILRALGVGPATHKLYSSPQGRARITAQIVQGGADWPLTPDARISEISVGCFEGHTQAENRTRYPETFAGRGPLGWYFQTPNGETEAAMTARVAAFLDQITGPSVIVTHGITSRFLRGSILGLDLAGMLALDGGQGVVYRLSGGVQERLGG